MWAVPNVFLAQYIDQCCLNHQYREKYTKTYSKKKNTFVSCYLDIYIRPSCILSAAENIIHLIMKYKWQLSVFSFVMICFHIQSLN